MRVFLDKLKKVLASLPLVLGSGASVATMQDTASEVDAEWKIAELKNTHAAYATFAIDHPDSPMTSEALQRLENAKPSLESNTQESAISEPADDRQGNFRVFNPNSLINV